MEYLDVIVLAIVAVVIALRLRSVLGQRRDDEPRKPNPFGVPKAGKDEDDEGFMLSPKHEAAMPAPAAALPAPVLAPDSLAGGLTLIKQRAPHFDEKEFLQGARSAFNLIVVGFAQGEMEKLRPFLGPEVFQAFDRAVAARRATGQRLETKIHAIKEVEVTKARLSGDIARLTVRFVSEQSNATYDETGQLVDGSPTQREVIEDIWCFARNLKQDNPAWLLVETRV